MKIVICKDSKSLGIGAANLAADTINSCIDEKGSARIVLSTGASQLPMFDSLIEKNIDWSKVEMYHLDEYVGISETHIASFRKYLKERFIAKVNLKSYHLVDGTSEGIADVTNSLRAAPIDLGLIGIGENAHIAFNDPPADFDSTDAYIMVNLSDTCKKQQVGEGWFASADDVPKQAVSMTVYQILQCQKIISCVPYAVKADAIQKMLTCKAQSDLIPATALKGHADYTLFVDEDSFSLVNEAEIVPAPCADCVLEKLDE